MVRNKIAEYDFIKGIAILSVILLHTVSRQFLFDSYAFFYIWQAVPVFILVSYILIFRKNEREINIITYFKLGNVQKIFKRIIIPYLTIQAIIFIIGCLKGNINLNGFVFGVGPGAYYPFVYIQLWLTAPFLFYLLNKYKSGGG